MDPTIITFLFTSSLSPERLSWVTEFITPLSPQPSKLEITDEVRLWVTGDALYSLIDARNSDAWYQFSGTLSRYAITWQIYIDFWESCQNGLSHTDFDSVLQKGICKKPTDESRTPLQFWIDLISSVAVS
jgi:hypothetical protein